MRFRIATTLAALVAAALPAAATASPPWTPPAFIPASASGSFTAAVPGAVLTAQPRGDGFGPTQLALVSPEGTVSSTVPLTFAGSFLATYGKRIAVAGRTVAGSGPYVGTITDSSSIVVRLGPPAALGATRTVAGTKGQQLYGLASNDAGLMAIATGTARTRSVFVRRAGSSTFTRKLRIAVTSRARGATVAVGAKGDMLFVYEDDHVIRVRHIGPRETVGAVHQLGSGVQSDLQAIVNDDGRLAVAWKSQRVSEGEAGTPAIVWFTTAAPGRGFGTARRIATVGATGAGRYVASPGVRLLARGDDALLANTGFDGTNYTVEARRVIRGHLGVAERLSPAGVDAVLGDAAVAPNGAQLVVWRSGIAGADPRAAPGTQPPHAPVLASVRAAGPSTFGAPELVSAADADVLSAPSAALDPVSGRAIVAFGIFSAGAAQLASRPAF
jgi:hypothetical protein